MNRGFPSATSGSNDPSKSLASRSVSTPSVLHNGLPAALQEMLEAASIEGEGFTAEVVAQARGAGEPETIRRLSGDLAKQHRLVRGQDSLRLASGGQRLSRYRFRHILFQKYVYNNLDEGERAYLHEAVGKALEQLYEGHTEPVAIRLARHFEAAGLDLKAVDYLEQAGVQAVRRYAYQEAILIFDRAVALLKTLPDTPERAQRELTVQIARGNALIAVKGFASPEVRQAYTRARVLSQQAEARAAPQFFPALWGLWLVHFTQAEHKTAQELGEQLLSLAQDAQEPDLALQAHHALWTSLLYLGDFSSARMHCQRGAALYDAEQHHPLTLRYGGHDTGVCSRNFEVPALWILGYADQALQRSREAIALAEELSHPFSLALSQPWLAVVHQLRGEPAEAQESAEIAIELATEHGFALVLGWATPLRGWVRARQGQVEEGIGQMRCGLDAYRATGAAMDQTQLLAILAGAYGLAGQCKAGLDAVAQALAAAEETGERFYEAELHRLKGELLLAHRGAGAETHRRDAEACYQRALEVARSQGAKSWELRAAVSLGRLWQGQGKSEEARRMLAESYGWFTEGFDTADLREAKMLLEELSQCLSAAA